MSDVDELGRPRIERRNHALRERFERHRALRSAWQVLLPAGAAAGAQHIAETAQSLRAELDQMASSGVNEANPALLERFDSQIGAFEKEMRGIAFEIPARQLRDTLPAQMAADRRSVLDLLDVILGDQPTATGEGDNRIGLVDSLITLLCTGPDEAESTEVADPVALTPLLHATCQRSAERADPEAGAVAARFFAAIDLDDSAERDALQRHKVSLGSTYFDPNVLRAIVTYNLAALRRNRELAPPKPAQRELTRTEVAPQAKTEQPVLDDCVSVFESAAIPNLGEAIRRREGGETPTRSDVDRVAWCLDLASASVPERVALLSDEIGTRNELKGTVVLVGLLCRAAVVLEDELSTIGISLEALSTSWIRELDAALKQETNERLAAGVDYVEAAELTELKSKYLYGRIAGERKVSERPKVAAEPESVSREATQLAQEAMSGAPTRVIYGGEASRLSPQRVRLAQGLCLLGVLAMGLVLALPEGERAGFGGNELRQLSPYLERGERNGYGVGAAFIGRVVEQWDDLDYESQRLSAEALIDALRDQGMDEIMIYDAEGQPRIQAFGDQEPRVLPAN